MHRAGAGGISGSEQYEPAAVVKRRMILKLREGDLGCREYSLTTSFLMNGSTS